MPANELETAGARLTAADLVRYRGHPKVIGLAEFMNFPGVIHKDPGCLAKLDAFWDEHIDGHAPLLRGNDLNGYLSAGIRTDHECTTAEEALEKIRKGMHILVREGSVSKDLGRGLRCGRDGTPGRTFRTPAPRTRHEPLVVLEPGRHQAVP